jgi:hypothetical protein
LQTLGWDRAITNDTQILNMKMFGTNPATYAVSTSVSPPPGQSSVSHTFSSSAGGTQRIASGGSVTLTTLTTGISANGTFALSFAANSLNGTYKAVFCPGGREP